MLRRSCDYDVFAKKMQVLLKGLIKMKLRYFMSLIFTYIIKVAQVHAAAYLHLRNFVLGNFP